MPNILISVSYLQIYLLDLSFIYYHTRQTHTVTVFSSIHSLVYFAGNVNVESYNSSRVCDCMSIFVSSSVMRDIAEHSDFTTTFATISYEVVTQKYLIDFYSFSPNNFRSLKMQTTN